MTLALAAALVLAASPPAGYFPFVIPWDALAPGSAVDVSSLNQSPAGSGGFITPRNGTFVEEHSGRRVRFFATNLGARAAFPSNEDADKIAGRMAQLGINLVRLHHLQNTWEKPEGTIWKPGKPHQEVDPAQLEKLDYLIHALRSHGIYVNLNLSTTREYVPELGFPPSVRQIPFTHHKKVDLFDRHMIEVQKDYARALLDRTNRFTGRAYKDEPALAFVEINNENSLVGWPGESPGEGLGTLPEPFRGEIVSLWNAWLSGRYGDDDRLVSAWTEAGPEPGRSSIPPGARPYALDPEESLARRNVNLATDAASGPRAEDWTEFLAATDKAYAEEMRHFLKSGLGLRANLIDTQVQWGGLTALGREASMEYADAHGYWQHPSFAGAAWDPVHWTVGRRPLVEEMDRGQGLLGELALERLAGKPFTVSEYNHPAPNDYRVEMMPLLSTFALLQDWDGFYTFIYPATGTGEGNDRIEGFFDTGLDPTKVALYPSTALIFRKGLLPPLPTKETVTLPDRPWRLAGSATDVWRQTGGPPDTLSSRTALAVDSGTALRRQPTGTPEPPAALVARNSRGAVYRVDTPAAKVLTGFIGGGRFSMTGVTLSFPDFGRNGEGFGALTLVDLEGHDVGTTRRALLTLVGNAENQGMGWNADRTSVGDQWGEGPVVAEGIPCVVSLPTTRRLKVFPLDASGKRAEPLAVVRQLDRLTFRVGPESKTLWYEIAER